VPKLDAPADSSPPWKSRPCRVTTFTTAKKALLP
jgi:hypothetical protein